MKRAFYFLLIFAAVLYISGSCKEEAKKSVSTAPVTFAKEGTLSVYRAESDSLLAALDIEIAESDYETQTGLMYRESMEQNQGMLFIFPEEAYHSFYMKNTRFPLDIIYIDKDLMVTSIVTNAQPMNETGLPSENPIMYVLEVNAGLTDRWQLENGDKIVFHRLISD
ncbi:MAG: DUF192 domain-containing protein [Flavobacteriaceae bacterium]|nr:DUF192 domain-containing protein [Muriicola sp.]NNL38896.1 DUF192 domain-containing protein [Flavobacteriaceae bacterium]